MMATRTGDRGSFLMGGGKPMPDDVVSATTETVWFARDNDGWHKVLSVRPVKNKDGHFIPSDNDISNILDTRRHRADLMPFWAGIFPAELKEGEFTFLTFFREDVDCGH